MNKKFLSVALSVCMIFSSMEGYYCFAEDETQLHTQLHRCYKQLEECDGDRKQLINKLSKFMSKDVIKKLELDFNKILPDQTDGNKLTDCYNELKKCKLQNANYKTELIKCSESISESSIFGKLNTSFKGLLKYSCYFAGGLFFLSLFSD